MKCVTPIKLTGQKLAVPCGRCYACKRNYQMNWIIRLKEEMKVAVNAYFITLTYNEEFIPRDRMGYTHVHKPDVQKFFKRLRKRIGTRSKIRYYLASEYGPKTFRPHYHAIIFNLPFDDVMKNRELIAKAWSLDGKSMGHVQCDEVNENRIGYVTGYCMDKDKDTKSGKKVFSLMSQGLGKNYLDQLSRLNWHKENPLDNMYYPLENGKKVALPRYYRTKIIQSEISREVLRGISEKDARIHYIKNKERIHEEFGRDVSRIQQLEIRDKRKRQLRKL